jgi:hypothetical protein
MALVKRKPDYIGSDFKKLISMAEDMAATLEDYQHYVARLETENTRLGQVVAEIDRIAAIRDYPARREAIWNFFSSRQPNSPRVTTAAQALDPYPFASKVDGVANRSSVPVSGRPVEWGSEAATTDQGA